ncbi:trans-aconitate 2-methyltransferase [Streptomyces sp. VRA16 Mangrove soil]|uniref:trans-aconitate 2-methyltransferase n=1 Tax=Streptomyces sp. VRA16 Mangrove soil TaxID=2817434 RepID=UPI001A9D40F1|nr:trans-aconitate 2-methyltransferase [Streptomyces sp. VRA16 Mangrove soil]MBO1336537.1 trans-aconitate 2-methyltransferase [Streptomyces sp. VRA16 Mangrove soil]
MTTTSPTWDPQQYLRHADHRGRPFADLLARVPALPRTPARIADLGCGPGNTTPLLAERWPDAHITGYDNSHEMLEKAQAVARPGLDFAYADATDWTPAPGTYDLIASNATLQWVPGHVGFFPAWLDALVPGGTFAFQVPGNFDAPSHALMRELAASARWKDRLGGVLRHADAVLDPTGYLEHLAGLGCEVDAWETTYTHLLQGEDPVLDWVKGTGLRPVLTALADDTEARDAFVAEYRDLLREAYPATTHGTVLPFRRIFAVAVKTA